eukprot:1525937-Prorocentrum_lima.AAC.1
MTTTIGSSSASSGATAHFGVTTEGIPFKTGKPILRKGIVEDRSPSIKRGPTEEGPPSSPSKRHDRSPAPIRQR